MNCRSNMSLYLCLCIMGCESLVFAKLACFNSEGSLNFNKYNQFCCGGLVYDKEGPQGEMSCCGAKAAYKKHSQICCGSGEVLDRIIQKGEIRGKEQRCCGNKTYLADTIRGDTHCCGNEFIRNDYDCCHGKSFNRNVSRCVNSKHVIPRGHDFCNGVQYDTRKRKCCDNSVLHNVSTYDRDFRCCGSALFDETKERCCSGNVNPKTGQCCGTGLYHPDREICCRQKVIASNGTLDCCGAETYDKQHQDCCSGTNIQKETEKCCQGTVHNTINIDNPQCCGKQIYSPASQLCCTNDVINKTKPTHNRCCYGKTSFSCENTHDKRCGNQQYDNQKDLCCNMQVHKGVKESGKKCCNPAKEIYDPKKEVCLHGEIHNKTDIRHRIPAPPGPPGSGSPATGKEVLQTIGISTACSPQWTPSKMRKFIVDKKINICRRNAYVLDVKSSVIYNRQGPVHQGTLLNVTMTHSINNARNDPVRNRTFTLDLPCSSENLQKQNYKILLVTDMDVEPPRTLFYLGDSDIILPYNVKIRKIVKRKLNFCDKHIVRNIYSFLKKTFKGKNRMRSRAMTGRWR